MIDKKFFPAFLLLFILQPIVAGNIFQSPAMEGSEEIYPADETLVLDNSTYNDPETGLCYEIVKAKAGGKMLEYSMNKNTSLVQEGLEQIQDDRDKHLSSLPAVYRKMSHSLREEIEGEPSEEFPVIFIAEDSDGLAKIEDRIASLNSGYKKWDGDLIKFVSTRLDPSSLRKVSGMDEVKAVWYNRNLSLKLSASVPLVKADQVRSNVSGASLSTVAVVDSGVDSSHPALKNNVILRGDFSDGDLDPGTGDPDDFAGHGTLVAGIIASQDTTYAGIAPNAKIISVKTALALDYLCAGVDWAISNGADVIQMSMAHDYAAQDTYGDSETTKFVDYVAYVKDITYVISAGNQDDTDNPDARIEAPADNYNGISVGATAGSTMDELQIWEGSARDKTDDGRTKIDVVAPGGFIQSCNYKWETASDYTWGSGTSMAAPHVSGLAALLFHWGEANSQLNDAVLIKAAIMNSAMKPDGWSHASYDPLDLEWGAGFIDSVEALNTYKSRPATQPTGYRLHSRIVYDASARFHRINVSDAPTNITATLVWRRNVSDYAKAPPYITDYDLYLYDGDMYELDHSTSSLNNVEHIHHEVNENGTYWLKVETYGPLENGFEYYAVAANHEMIDYGTASCTDCDGDGVSNKNDCAPYDPARGTLCNGECVGTTSNEKLICQMEPSNPRCGWKSVRYDSDNDRCDAYAENPVMADQSHEWYELGYDDSCWSDVGLGDPWQEDCDQCDKFYRKKINVPGRLAQMRYKIASDDGYRLWIDSTNWEASTPDYSEGGTCSGTSYQGGCATSCESAADNDAWNDVSSAESCGTGCNITFAVHVYESSGAEWFDMIYDLEYCGDGTCDSSATNPETSSNCPQDCPTATTTSTTTSTTSTTSVATSTTSTTTSTTMQCSSCSNACTLSCNTNSSSYSVPPGAYQYFKYTLTAARNVKVTVNPASGDPDLYTYWNTSTSCPTESSCSCKSAQGGLLKDICPTSGSRTLSAGTYRLSVYGWTASTYTVTLECSATTTSTTTSTAAPTSTTTSTTITSIATTTSTTSTTISACRCGNACTSTDGCTDRVLTGSCLGASSCDGKDDIEDVTLTNLGASCAVNAGDSVEVDVLVECYSASDRIELWYYNGTGWRLLYTDPQCDYPAATGHYYTSFTVDNAAQTQYVRAINGYGWTGGSPCYTSPYGDNDDLALNVNTSASSTTTTTTSTSSSAASSTTSSTAPSTSTTATTTSTTTTAPEENVTDLGAVKYNETPKTWQVSVPEGYTKFETTHYDANSPDNLRAYSGWNGYLKINNKWVWRFKNWVSGEGTYIYDCTQGGNKEDYPTCTVVLDSTGYARYLDATDYVSSGYNNVTYYHYTAGDGIGTKIRITSGNATTTTTSTSTTSITTTTSTTSTSSTTVTVIAVSIQPQQIEANAGDTFSINVESAQLSDAYSAEIRMKYDPSVLNATSLAGGDFLTADGSTQYADIGPVIDNVLGTIQYLRARSWSAGGIVASGSLIASAKFRAKAPGATNITIQSIDIRTFDNGNPATQQVRVENALIIVTGGTTSTTSSTTSSTAKTTTTASSTTTAACSLAGDTPPCGAVTLSEVVDYINLWASGQASLSDVVALINGWAG